MCLCNQIFILTMWVMRVHLHLKYTAKFTSEHNIVYQYFSNKIAYIWRSTTADWSLILNVLCVSFCALEDSVNRRCSHGPNRKEYLRLLGEDLPQPHQNWVWDPFKRKKKDKTINANWHEMSRELAMDSLFYIYLNPLCLHKFAIRIWWSYFFFF